MTDDRLSRLVEELAIRVAKSYYVEQKAVELGRFVEAVHKAMRSLYGFSEKALIDQWHEPLNHAAPSLAIHSKKYIKLHVIYDYRNMGGHENEEALQISQRDVDGFLRDINELLPKLAADVEATGKDLVSEILRQRKTLIHNRRAQLLADAIFDGAQHDGKILESSVWQAVVALLPSPTRGIAKDPNLQRRISRALQVLAQGARVDETCPLRGAARVVGPTLDNRAPIDDWLCQDHARLVALSPQARRVNVFRVELDRDPEGDGWLVLGASVVSPSLALLDEAIPHDRFPLRAPTNAALCRGVMDIFRCVGQAAYDASLPSRPSEYVLHFAMPAEVAMEKVELVRPAPPRPTIASQFLAVAIEPMDDEWTCVELDDPLEVPRTVALLWRFSGDTDELSTAAFSCTAVLAGPATWESDFHGRRPILWALSERAVAFLCPHENSDSALADLGLDDGPVPWAELIEHVGRHYQRPPEPMKVLWSDRRYQPLIAQPLDGVLP